MHIELKKHIKGKNIIIDVLSLSLYNCVLVKKVSIGASNRLGECRPRCVCRDLRVERLMGFCGYLLCISLHFVMHPYKFTNGKYYYQV